MHPDSQVSSLALIISKHFKYFWTIFQKLMKLKLFYKILNNSVFIKQAIVIELSNDVVFGHIRSQGDGIRSTRREESDHHQIVA